jgi:outer membrane protein OmpA-like peptidoglycan-associated protein
MSMYKYLLFFLLLSTTLSAQQSMKATRSQVIPWGKPVANIFVDAENNKWVAHTDGLSKVLGVHLAAQVGIETDEQSAAEFKGGNAHITWKKSTLLNLTGDIFDGDNRISCAHYDENAKELWLGTTESGLFHFDMSAGLALIKNYTSGNSKLRSDQINDLYIDAKGRVWAATYDGVVIREAGKWKLIEKDLSIEAIAGNGADIWLMGDGLVGKVNSKDAWNILALPQNQLEGEMKDIAVDAEGQLWIASGVITRYNPETKDYDIFGPAEEYTSQFATCLTIDQEGIVWIGTRDKGVYFLREGTPFAIACRIRKPLDCNGDGKDAELEVEAEGGTAPFTYEWTGGLQGASPTGVGAGGYKVTVTDSKGEQAIASVTLLDLRVQATATQLKAADNDQANGQAEVSVKGGQPPLTYAWSNGATTPKVEQLAPGKYTVTVVDKAKCQGVAEVTITEALAALAVEVNTKDLSCGGASDALIEVVASGGQPPYTYSWTIPGVTGNKKDGLGPGSYGITVTDAQGSQQAILKTISDIAAIAVNVIIESPASTGAKDGIATAEVKNGAAPYTYNWDTGEAGATAKQLGPGVHTLTVTDSKGCKSTASVTIEENILPLQLSLKETQSLDCNGDATAALEAIVRGGKAPYTYIWQGTGQTAHKAQSLAAGTYTISVTDASGLTATAEATIVAPGLLTAEALGEAPASTGNSDGQASVSAKGGTSPYTYQWDNGEKEALAKTLSPGAHTVTVTDAKGCTTTAKIDITEDILPLQLSLEVVQAPNCSGDANGSLEVSVKGGKPPYQYQWQGTDATTATAQGLPAGTFAVTVTDASGLTATANGAIVAPDLLTAEALGEAPASTGNSDGQASVNAKGGTSPYTYQWDNGEKEALAKTLSPGTHTVTVTDAKGCTTTAKIDITEDILPLQLSLEVVQALNCSGDANGSLEVSVKGGKPPYQYQWQGTDATTATASGLGAGNYTVIVSDASGLTQQKEAQFTAPQPLQLEVKAEAPANTGQADGRAQAIVSGGTAPYTYAWDSGETEAAAKALAPGTRELKVKDANGCETTANVEIGEDIQPLTVELEVTENIACNGGNNGEITAQVRGGKPPYQYQWEGAEATSAQLTDLPVGTYTLVVSDASGLSKNASVTLDQPAALSAAVTLRSPASTGNADGVAFVEVKGGTTPYTYNWSSGATADEANGLAPGIQTVTVTDAQGCTATAEVEVNENILPLQVSLNEKQPIRCKDESNGVLEATVTGGKAPYYYDWSHNSLNSATAAELPAASYSLTVTDAVENETIVSYELKEPEKLTIDATVLSPASTGNSDGVAEVTVKGGTGAYTYQWKNGTNAPKVESLAPGFHTVVVKDERNCETSVTFEVTENILPLNVQLSLSKELKCAGQNNAEIIAEVSGGKPPYQYQWNEEAQTTASLTNLGAGTYKLTLSDVLGSTATATLTIEAPPALEISFTDITPAFSEDSEDGKASVAISGGTPPYAYAWDNGENTMRVEKLAIGTHSVTVTDNNSCSIEGSFEIKERIMKELASGALRSGQTINMQKLQFDADSVKIREDARPILDEVYQFLNDNASIVVEIGGHTNNLPPPAYCDSLSTARAKAVAEYLVAKGIAAERVYYKGYGKRKPVFSNATADGRMRNQRVEIKILRL